MFEVGVWECLVMEQIKSVGLVPGVPHPAEGVNRKV